ncbi:MAG: NADH-quinone oxidoreductase subunit I [Crenarchaeota archaeon]|nr:NADH-quinone oxidoreductase subunit I [Thermoproteota archaeon]
MPSSIRRHIDAIVTGFKHLRYPPLTLSYPEAVEERPPGYRGFILYEPEKCLGCGLCAQICPARAIKMHVQGRKRRPGYSMARCIFCGLCVDICPAEALEPSSIHDEAFEVVEHMELDPEEWGQRSRELRGRKPAARVVRPVIDEVWGIRYERVG